MRKSILFFILFSMVSLVFAQTTEKTETKAPAPKQELPKKTEKGDINPEKPTATTQGAKNRGFSISSAARRSTLMNANAIKNNNGNNNKGSEAQNNAKGGKPANVGNSRAPGRPASVVPAARPTPPVVRPNAPKGKPDNTPGRGPNKPPGRPVTPPGKPGGN
ncbi:MAG TPA: hypothetical protein VK921_18505 [Anditalea sp.]|nr:hypothetical protein [Anditalea sp.]